MLKSHLFRILKCKLLLFHNKMTLETTRKNANKSDDDENSWDVIDVPAEPAKPAEPAEPADESHPALQ